MTVAVICLQRAMARVPSTLGANRLGGRREGGRRKEEGGKGRGVKGRRKGCRSGVEGSSANRAASFFDRCYALPAKGDGTASFNIKKVMGVLISLI